MNIVEQKQKRASIVTQARSFLDKAETEGRALTTEEETSYNKAMDDVEKLSLEIERETRQQNLERGLGKPEEIIGGKLDTEGRAKEEKEKEIRTAFGKGLSSGNFGEYRSLQMTDATQAGYLVAPEQFVATLIKDLDNYFFIRQYAKKLTIAGTQSLGFPKRTARASKAIRGTELAAPTPDTTLAFGKREFRPKWMTAEILVSKPLLQNAAIDPEQIVRAELAYAFGQTQEIEFMTGNG